MWKGPADAHIVQIKYTIFLSQISIILWSYTVIKFFLAMTISYTKLISTEVDKIFIARMNKHV